MVIPKAEEELYRLQAELCRGMAHPTRMRMLMSLKEGEKPVNELAKVVGVTQANASQHLAILRQFGLLSTRRDGSTIYYRISDNRITEACEIVRSCVGERLKKSQMVLAVTS